MQYKIITNNSVDIFETATEQVIKTYSKENYNKAKKLMKHLNLGGGFDGWTPTFFARGIKFTSNTST